MPVIDRDSPVHAVEIEAETIVDDLHAVGNQIGGMYFKDYSCINHAYLYVGFCDVNPPPTLK